jgi:hypothetical protein
MFDSTVNAAATDEGDSAASPNAFVSNTRWVIAISMVGLMAWLGFTYPPKYWRIPDELADVSAMSPKEDIAKLKAVTNETVWKNSLMKFGVAGSLIGLVGFFLLGKSGGTIGSGITALVAGVLFGLAAGAVGLVTRRYLDLEYPIPLISQESRPLFCDAIVFSIVNILLVMPIFLWLIFHREPTVRMRAFSVPLAALLAGIAVPVAGAIFLPGYTNTSYFPSNSIGLNSLWFACLAVSVIVVFSGHKRKDPTAIPETN